MSTATITFRDSDDSEEALFSYVHDAILEWDNEQNGRELSDTDAILAIASVVWDALQSRRVHAQGSMCPKCGVTVTDQTPSAFYAEHDERCGWRLEEPETHDSETPDTPTATSGGFLPNMA